MMIDPMEVMKKHAPAGPIPTVLPDDITYQEATAVGNRTLW